MNARRDRLEIVLSQRIRELAAERGLPLTHVADRSGLARSYLWKLLDAESSATLEVVQRLADAFEVPVLDLLKRSTAFEIVPSRELAVAESASPRRSKPRTRK